MSLQNPKNRSKTGEESDGSPPKGASWNEVGNVVVELEEESENLVNQIDRFFNLVERAENGFLADLKRKIRVKKKVEDFKEFKHELEDSEESLYHYLGTTQTSIQKARKTLYLTSKHRVSGERGFAKMVEGTYDDLDIFVESDPNDLVFHASTNSEWNEAQRGYSFDPRTKAVASILNTVSGVESQAERVEKAIENMMNDIRTEIERNDSREQIDEMIGMIIEDSRNYEEMEKIQTDVRRGLRVVKEKRSEKPLNQIT